MKMLIDQIQKLRYALTEPYNIAEALQVVDELEAMTKFSSMLKHEWRTLDTAPPVIRCMICNLDFGDVRARLPCVGAPVIDKAAAAAAKKKKKAKHARVLGMSRSRTR